MADPKQGALAVWSKYYDQADPLVIFKGDEWVELTIDDLVAAIPPHRHRTYEDGSTTEPIVSPPQ